MRGAFNDGFALIALAAAAVTASLAWLLRRVFPRRRVSPNWEGEVIVWVATTWAQRRRHALVLPEHLLLAALFHERVVAAIERCGADPAALRSALEEHLAGEDPDAEDPAEAPVLALSRAAGDVLRDARLRAGGRGVLAIDVVAAIASAKHDGFAKALLDRAGVTEATMSFHPPDAAPPVARSAAPYRRAPEEDQRVPVVFWNDSATSMELVVAVLVAHFDKSELEAEHLMRAVHHAGQAIVGRYPQEEAEERAARGMADARNKGMPLRISVGEPPPVDSLSRQGGTSRR